MKFIVEDDLTNLFDLIWLCCVPILLEVYLFYNAFSPEKMMASFYPDLKTQMQQEPAQVIKANVPV